jgi:ribulose-phosphate 3-epimerase
MKIKIAPSILAGDFSRLGDEAVKVERAGADILHLDIMDGHFVPNLTLGPQAVEAIRKRTSLFIDCHLMIDNPEQFAERFIKAGANNITFHVEVHDDVRGMIHRIKELGANCGMSLKPDTPIEAIFPYFSEIEMLLIMTVYPGFGGQDFMPECLPRIRAARKEAQRLGINLDIEVDGGINEETAPLVIEAGANVLVAGTAIYGTKNTAEAIRKLRGK